MRHDRNDGLPEGCTPLPRLVGSHHIGCSANPSQQTNASDFASTPRVRMSQHTTKHHLVDFISQTSVPIPGELIPEFRSRSCYKTCKVKFWSSRACNRCLVVEESMPTKRGEKSLDSCGDTGQNAELDTFLWILFYLGSILLSCGRRWLYWCVVSMWHGDVCMLEVDHFEREHRNFITHKNSCNPWCRKLTEV